MNSEWVALVEIVIILGITGILGAVAWLLVWGLLRAGSLRPSVALVIALSILTAVSIIGSILTQTSGQQSTELATLAGMGLGGLAGAVTAVWGEDRRMAEEDTRTDQPDPEPAPPAETPAVDPEPVTDNEEDPDE